jgi:hypothetical protein
MKVSPCGNYYTEKDQPKELPSVNEDEMMLCWCWQCFFIDSRERTQLKQRL